MKNICHMAIATHDQFLDDSSVWIILSLPYVATLRVSKFIACLIYKNSGAQCS